MHSSELRVNVFPVSIAPKRTDEGFRNRSYIEHYQVYKKRETGKLKKIFVVSPILRLPIDVIEDVIVSDSLHLLHLGITKKLLTMYKEGQMYYTKWSKTTTERIDDILSHIKLPCEIHRRMRGLRSLCHWKASECASFLNYVGIALLKHFVDKQHYTNFVNLFYAITICSSKHYETYLPVAQTLLETFIQNYNKYFRIISSNTHNLVHIVDEVKRFGPLPTISSYPFENFLFQIKNMVRSGRLPLNQIINRISEKRQDRYDETHIDQPYPTMTKPLKHDNLNFLSCKLREGFTLTNNFQDKWFLSNEKKVIAMICVNQTGIVGSELKHFVPHIQKPFPSDVFYVFKTTSVDSFNPQKVYPFQTIFCKLVAIQIQEETVFVPLHHTLPM